MLNAVGTYQYRLEAIAVGPKGRYHVAYSPTFRTDKDVSLGGGSTDGEGALDESTVKLITDG